MGFDTASYLWANLEPEELRLRRLDQLDQGYVPVEERGGRLPMKQDRHHMQAVKKRRAANKAARKARKSK